MRLKNQSYMQIKIFILFLLVSSFCFSQDSSNYIKKNIIKLDKYYTKAQQIQNDNNLLLKYYLYKIKKLSNIDDLYSKEINNKIESAKHLSYNSDFERSNEICFEIIKEISKFKSYKYLSEQTFDLIAKNYAYLKDTNNCNLYATEYCKTNFASLEIFFNPVIISILGKEKINELSRIQDSVFLKKNIEKSISFESVFLIRYLIKKDQFLLLEEGNREHIYNQFSKELENTLEFILSNHYFPNYVLIDDFTIIYFSVLYSHTSTNFKLKYLKKFADFLEKIDHHKDGIKPIIDKILVDKYQEQLYGTQVYGKDGKCTLYPITKRPESEIRKELGLDN